METPNESLHVVPLSDGWAVEKESGASVAQEEEKHEAIEAALQVSSEEAVSEIVVHAPDGAVEKTIPPNEPAEERE